MNLSILIFKMDTCSNFFNKKPAFKGGVFIGAAFEQGTGGGRPGGRGKVGGNDDRTDGKRGKKP